MKGFVEKKHRYMALLLCLCTAAGMFSAGRLTYASEETCIAHQAYDDVCGYAEVVEGQESNSISVSGLSEDYVFNSVSGELTVTNNNGITGWRKDTTIAPTEKDRYAAIKSVVCTEGVTEVGGAAFQECRNLTTVRLSKSMIDYWGHPFEDCTSLTAIEVAAENPKYAAIDGVLYDKTDWSLLYCPQGKGGSLAVAEGAITIKAFAFSGCNGLTSVTLPGSLELIKQSGFFSCPSLSELHFTGDKAPKAENYAFAGLAKQGTLLYTAGVPGYEADKFGYPDLTDEWVRKPVGSPGTVYGEVGFAGREWWIIGRDGAGIRSRDGTMTLLAQSYWQQTSFDTAGNRGGTANNQYGGSILQSVMENIYQGILPSEQKKILPQTLNNVRVESDYDATMEGEHCVWPLSYEESIRLPENVRSIQGPWWLRSARFAYSSVGLSSKLEADVFGRDENVDSSHAENNFGARPSLVLGLDSVLFTSAAADGKTALGSNLQAYSAPSGIFKFTMIDDTILSLKLEDSELITAGNGEKVDIPYNSAAVGTGRSVSVLIADKNTGEFLYYGRPGDCETRGSGIASFVLPGAAELPEGGYKLLVFNEQVNGNNVTDFASTPVEIPLTVDNTPRYMITASAGPGGNIDPEGRIVVKQGENKPFTVTAEAGFQISQVLVDGIPQPLTNGEYVFLNVDKDHTIDAKFEQHIHTYGDWKYDDIQHWAICADDGTVSEKEAHQGGAANCHQQAVCEVCGVSYGKLVPGNHTGGTETRNTKAAAETEQGYTGDIYCMGCGEMIEKGKVIPKQEVIDKNDTPQPGRPGKTDTPQTGDDTVFWLWFLVMLAALIVSGSILIYRKE